MVCKKCNKAFEKKPHVNSRVKYCEACRWLTCEVCSKRKRMNTGQIENPSWGRFCSHKCEVQNKLDTGKIDHRFMKSGYWCVKSDHPRAYSGSYYEHILVLEKKIGRLLDTSFETCHHKDSNKLNNSPENLELKTKSEHSKYHMPAVSWSEDVGIDHLKYSHHIKKRCATERTENGYVFLFKPDSPMSSGRGYVLRARWNMSQHLGRLIEKDEIVLHKNGKRDDDTIENLKITKRNTPFSTGTPYSYTPLKGFTVEHGYITIWNPKHSMARKNGYVLEHRLIMSNYIGRNLEPREHVHHKNGNRMDNRIENLELLDCKDHPSKHFHK